MLMIMHRYVTQGVIYKIIDNYYSYNMDYTTCKVCNILFNGRIQNTNWLSKVLLSFIIVVTEK